MNKLNKRVAIVTGAGNGIGEAVAVALAEEGASVIVNDLGVSLDGSEVTGGAAEKVARRIRESGGKAVANFADVSDHEAASSIIQAALDEFGKLDVLINVAGIVRDRMVYNMTEQEWDAVIAVHLKGTFNTTKWASKYWREKRAGNYRLINVTSGSGLFGNPGQPNYSAAKMGVVGLTLSCANALYKYGVACMAIAPGADTRMTSSVPSDHRVWEEDPEERSPRSITPAFLYLASDRSAWLNGRILDARGYTMSLYNTIEPVRQLVSPVPWDVDRAFELIEQTFRSEIDGTNLVTTHLRKASASAQQDVIP